MSNEDDKIVILTILEVIADTIRRDRFDIALNLIEEIKDQIKGLNHE